MTSQCIIKLTPFEFSTEQITAQADLKQALLELPLLCAINYNSSSPVILAVDSSFIAVGFQLCQCNKEDPKMHYYNRFSSIMLNDREWRFSQPKLEIYGLFCSLRALHLYLIDVRNLIIEVNARYIKGMVQNPDIAPSASINRWIVMILSFHFIFVYVPGLMHSPNGLLRCPRQPDNEEEEGDSEEFDDWVDHFYSFPHLIQPLPALGPAPLTSIFANDIRDDASEEPVQLQEDRKDHSEDSDDYSIIP